MDRINERESGRPVISLDRSKRSSREKLSELRAMLAEKGLSAQVERSGETEPWASGVTAIDEASGGGFPHGGISEVVAGHASSGTTLLMRGLLTSARRERRYVGLVDGHDCFDPATMGEELLPFLLWVRCGKTAQAMQAIDLLARDGNLSLLILDLRENPRNELRRQPPGVWHRLQRIAERTGVSLVALTPVPLVNSARLRFVLRRPLSLSAFDRSRDELLAELEVEQTRRQAGGGDWLRSAG